MARWREQPDRGVPADVMAAWVAGDPDGWVDAWLDALYDRDQDRWAAAFIALISPPSYTSG